MRLSPLQRGEPVWAPAVGTGVDGLNVVSYLTGFNEVRVAHCSDAACTAARISVVSRVGDFFNRTAVAIGGDGHPIVAFTNYDTRIVIAKCHNAACKGASQTTIGDASYPYGSDPRATAGADGFLLVAHIAGPTPSGPVLLVRHCQDLACRRLNTTEIDAYPPNDVFDISTDANGLGVVAYVRRRVGEAMDLVLAHCVDQACTRVTKTLIDASASAIHDVSVRTMADKRLLVVYNQSATSTPVNPAQLLKAAHCVPIDNDPCATVRTSVLDESAGGGSVELALGGDGFGLIGYRDRSIDNRWRIAHCVDAPCSAIQKGAAALDASYFALGSTAESPSKGLVVFRDRFGRLATEHCHDVACSKFSGDIP